MDEFHTGQHALDDVEIPIDEIYVPVKRKHDLKPEVVEQLAESIIENGLQVPINVRNDGKRYVLVSGLHRLEACRALGEDTITAVIVRARQR